MWWLIFSWLIGVGVCLWAVSELLGDAVGEMDKPWEKR